MSGFEFGFHFWYTLGLVVVMSVVLVKEYISADITVFSVLLLLVAGGVIDANAAFSGFSNHGMLTIGFLFVVAGALQRTGAMEKLGDAALGKTGNSTSKLFRFLPPVSAISAFFNNTPIVAMLTPAVCTWTKKNRLSASKYLIPLSYATILGGTCTLIGTSTNLVVHGLMKENGLRGMSFFEISLAGISVTVVGLIYLILVGHRLLPDRKEPLTQADEEIREFVVAFKVMENYKYIGKSIEDAGLRHLKGLFLFQIERNGKVKTSVSPKEKIHVHDYLFFTGLPETIVEVQKTPGLSLLKQKTFDLKNVDSENYNTYEAVISTYSSLIGKSVRDSDFRNMYQAVIIAIHRSGERVKEKIGDIVFRAGDTLLIVAEQDFIKKWYNSRDFYLVSRSVDFNSKPKKHWYYALTILLGMIFIMASGEVPVIVVAGAAAVIMVLSRCISIENAWNSINWQVLIVIASAFGISRALDQSGVAYYIAEKIVALASGYGTLGLLIGIYLVTNIYTEIITNNAAAALLIPVVLSVAIQTESDPRPFMFAVAIAASSSFSTPIGYQTNLMVYGPGGYKFSDFLKVGIPMNILVGITAITVIYLFYF